MSFYVERRREDRHDGLPSWTGPIRSQRQAHKEARAWQEAGWTAHVHPTSPVIRSLVRAWEQRKKEQS